MATDEEGHTVSLSRVKSIVCSSEWLHVYDNIKIKENYLEAKKKKIFEESLPSPPPPKQFFTFVVPPGLQQRRAKVKHAAEKNNNNICLLE